MKRAFRLSLVLAFLAAGAPATLADSSIRVLVNDKAITSYDISQRLRLMRLSGEKGGEKAAIDGLINDIIEISEAKRRGIEASEGRVNAAYASIAQGMKLSPAGLDKALKGEGVQPETLKRRIEAQMVWGQLIQAKARFEVTVKASEITDALFAEPEAKRTTSEYTLQQIVFVVPKGSSTGYAQQRRREAETFRVRYAGCEKAFEQAKGLRDVVVKSLGRRASTELVGKDGEEVGKTAAGKATRPMTVDAGVQLIGVCSIRELKGDGFARSEIENKLMLKQASGVGVEFLKELRAKAIIKYR